MSKSYRKPRVIACAVFALAVLPGCDRGSPRAPAAPPEVDVARPVVREALEWDEYTGRLAGVETVEIRPRVTGYLDQIHFKAGQIVKKGDLLFTIDPRPFKAELDRATGAVKQAQAELEHAKYDLKRIEGLQRDEAAPEKEYRDVVYAEQKARAELDQVLSEQRLAELNLEWSGIVAPVAGRIGRELVTVGNLVHDGSATATLLATIVSIDPIYCYFDADEQAYLKYARMSQSGERVSSRDHPNPVHVALFDETDFIHNGHMDFVDNAMDQLTGTIRARALLPNPNGILIPGLFVRVRLPGSGLRPMVFVPDTAIVTDQTTRLVFTVDSKNVVQIRTVVPGRLQNGLRRIISGLDGSESVVVNGVQRLRPGSAVSPQRVEVCPAGWHPDQAASTRPAPLTASMPTTTGAAP